MEAHSGIPLEQGHVFPKNLDDVLIFVHTISWKYEWKVKSSLKNFKKTWTFFFIFNFPNSFSFFISPTDSEKKRKIKEDFLKVGGRVK